MITHKYLSFLLVFFTSFLWVSLILIFIFLYNYHMVINGTKQTIKNQPIIVETITEASVDCESCYYLAMNIYHEGRCQPTIGKIAIGFVTLNRVADNRFPNTVRKVVTQSKQFSWYKKTKENFPKEIEQWKISSKIAEQILLGEINIDPTEGSTFYHTINIAPHWKSEKTKQVIIEDHVFYSWKKTEKDTEKKDKING